MKNIRPIKLVFFTFVFLLIFCEISVCGVEKYISKYLFEMKVGRNSDEFPLGFAGAPFGYQEGKRCLYAPLGLRY